ncbi:pectinesterase inhibitor 10-like protein [Tanacetum coccineum]
MWSNNLPYTLLQLTVMSSKAGAIQTSPNLLAQTALSISLDTTITTSSSMVKLSQVNGMAPRQVAAMKDCMELLSDSVFQMKKISSLKDEDTCSEGFTNDLKMKNVVRGKVGNVVYLTSNALGLISSYASVHG